MSTESQGRETTPAPQERSTWLLASAAEEVEASAEARLIREIITGDVDETAYARYLHAEEGFVRTAARVLGMAVWDAPGWEALTRHAAALHALVTEQTDYFARVREDWSVEVELGPRARAQAAGLSDHVLGEAHKHGYPAVVTGMLAAEHLYLTWCTRALETAELRGELPPAVREWVALHTRPPFTDQVKVLRAEVDALPSHISDDQLHMWFVAMLREEVRFHDAAYLED